MSFLFFERMCDMLWRETILLFFIFYCIHFLLYTVRECVICFGEGVNSLLLPCQHSGMCSVCAEAVFLYEVYTYMFIYMYLRIYIYVYIYMCVSRICRIFVVCTSHLRMCSVCAEAPYIYAVYICTYHLYAAHTSYVLRT